jgi:O-antigen ligase
VVALFAFLPLEHTQAMRHSLVVLVALRGAWLMLRHRAPDFFRRAWAVLPWAAWASLSYFWSVAPAATLSNLKHDLWLPLLAMFGCYQVFRYRCLPRVLLAAVAAGTLTNAIVTCFGAPGALLPLEAGRHYFSTVGYASTDALCFAVLALPWALGAGGGRYRLPALAVVLVNVATALITQNRMFFVAAALLLLTLPWLALDLRRRAVAGLVVAAVLLAGAFAVLNQERAETQTAGVGITEGLARVVQDEVRFEIWKRWAERAVAGPVLGTGFGRDVPPQTLRAEERDALRGVDPFAAMHSHNLFLNIAVEVGWPGLLCFLLFLARMAWQFHAGHASAPLAAASGLLLIAAVVLKNQTDVFMLFGPAILFYASLGSLTAWLDPGRSSS